MQLEFGQLLKNYKAKCCTFFVKIFWEIEVTKYYSSKQQNTKRAALLFTTIKKESNPFCTIHSFYIQISLKPSVAGYIGGSQEIILSYKSAPSMEDDFNKTVLEMKVRPDVEWVPISKPPESSMNFVSPRPGGQDVLFRLVREPSMKVFNFLLQ